MTPHVPVLLDEVIAALAIAPGETHVDATFGAGGYTRAMLKAGAAHVVAFDRDPDAIAEGAALVAEAGGRLTLVHDRFSNLADHGLKGVNGIAFDLGVSSMQFDRAERGFSFQNDGPADMRMSQEGESAADFLNSADEGEIADVIFHYGEEPRARRIARAIVAARPIERTRPLAEIVRRAAGYRPDKASDPATRTFQAIRIHLNGELDELDAGLHAAERALADGGRLAVVSFHSLEDRAVKRFLRDRSGLAPSGSRHLPESAPRRAPSFTLAAKPVRPSETEIARNPRARSATLRAAVRSSAAVWEN